MAHTVFEPNGSRNPFIGQVLRGSDAAAGGIVQYPVSFAVHDESAEVRSLYLSPICLQQIGTALPLDGRDQVVILSGGGPAVQEWGTPLMGVYTLYPVSQLAELQAPVEIVDFKPEATHADILEHVFEPVLAYPEIAVPQEIGSRFALTIDETCHAVLLTREAPVLSAVLTNFLQALQVSRLGRDADLPDLDAELLDELIQPVEDEAYHEVRFEPRRRHWTLEFRASWAGLWEAGSDSVRWVSEGEQGRWRTGWSW